MRQLLPFIVSAALLTLIYLLIDFSALIDAIRVSNGTLVVIGIFVLVPLTLATAWRLTILTGLARVGILEAGRLILLASTLNLFLPSKMGDVAKAGVLVERHGMDVKLALSISIFEKALDLGSLLLLGVIALVYVAEDSTLLWMLSALTAGLLIFLVVIIMPCGGASAAARFAGKILPVRLGGMLERFAGVWESVVLWYWSDWRRAVAVLLLSLGIWLGHLVQFWIFALAIGANIPFADNMAFATLAILAGLLPFTAAGIGSRDAALIFFYGAYVSPSQGALLGILATLRYIIPGIAGVPFVRRSFPGKLSSILGK